MSLISSNASRTLPAPGQASLRTSGTRKVWMKSIARIPPAIAVPPISSDPDFNATRPPRNAGIAAKTAIEWVVTGLPHDWQLIVRPGPRPALRARLIAGRLQYGHLTIVRPFANG